MSQKGIASIIIAIVLAVILVIGVIAYGFWSSSHPLSPTPQPSPVPQVSTQTPPLVNPDDPNCPDTDYTGCDTSTQFMTWTDDGERNPPAESTIYTK